MPTRHLAIIRPLCSSLLWTSLLAPVIAAAEPRDWVRFPAIAEVAAPHDLYALGDVHGDYDRLVDLLVAAGLLAAKPADPGSAQWAGGAATLVCTGDLIDKGNQSTQVIGLVRGLQSQAERAGGRFVVCLGNHEAEFLASGGAAAKAQEFAKELAAAGTSAADVAQGRDAGGIGQWLARLPAAAKVGDWFFCHAGNTGGRALPDLRRGIERQVTADGFGAAILADPNSLLEARMHPRPWWESDGSPIGLRDAAALTVTAEARLRAAVAALGAKHLVFGHQPGKVKFADGSAREAGQMYAAFNGLVFLIDTGMSRAVAGGRGAVLHVANAQDANPTVTSVYADGKTEPLGP